MIGTVLTGIFTALLINCKQQTSLTLLVQRIVNKLGFIGVECTFSFVFRLVVYIVYGPCLKAVASNIRLLHFFWNPILFTAC